MAQPVQPVQPVVRRGPGGAGAPPPGTHGRDHGPDRSRLEFSNYGMRLDAQGWGREVTTTGASGTGPVTSRAEPRRSPGTPTASPAPRPRCRWWPVRWRRSRACSGRGRHPDEPGAGPRGTARDRLTAAGRARPSRVPADRQPPGHQGGGDVPGALHGRLRPGRGYWDEILPYPRETPPRLRLFVAGAWRDLEHPEPELRRAVHSAFASGRPEVRVWFSDDEIVGLVIAG
ncbi:hypothetical protein NKH77_10840 [Streptomyces sp. M19]